jgi:hypothetical protein
VAEEAIQKVRDNTDESVATPVSPERQAELAGVAEVQSVAPKTNPELDSFIRIQKEEELFGYVISNLRQQGKGSQDIIDSWKTMKGTLNDSNIDLYLAEQKLRAIAQTNRAMLQQQPGTLMAGVEQAINRAKGKA